MNMTTTKKLLSPKEKMRNAFPDSLEKRNGWWSHANNPRFDWREDEDGNVHIKSWTGRDTETILSMGHPPLKLADLYAKKGTTRNYTTRDKLDLLTLSEYLELPWEFLSSLGYSDGYTYVSSQGYRTVCVKLGGYCTPDGETHRKNKVRLSIDGKTRFLWDDNTPDEPIPCGLHRLDEARQAGFLFCGEGESDAATMWFHGMPFLGISGSNAQKHLDVELFKDIPRIYLIEEPDQVKKNQESGQGFYKNMRQHLREQGYPGEIFSIPFKEATGCKDPSQLHKVLYRACTQKDEVVHKQELTDAFVGYLKDAMEQAIPEGNAHLEETIEDETDLFDTNPHPAPTTESAQIQWFTELCSVPAEILSPAHKIVLMVLCLHMQHWTPGSGWYKVDAAHLAKLAGMSKETFLSHLTYLEKKVELFDKKHERVWYTEEDSQQKKCTTDLYIQPSEKAMLTYPATYHVAEGVAPRKHGGVQAPQEKVKCPRCQSEHVDIHCRDCQQITSLPQDETDPAVESTALLQPLEDDTPQRQVAIVENPPCEEDEIDSGNLPLCPVIHEEERVCGDEDETHNGNLPIIENSNYYNRQVAIVDAPSHEQEHPLRQVAIVENPPDELTQLAAELGATTGAPHEDCGCELYWDRKGEPYCCWCYPKPGAGWTSEQRARLRRSRKLIMGGGAR